MPKIPQKHESHDILAKEHENHENHICEIVRKRNIMAAAQLVKDSKFICLVCGRTAAKEENLCVPIEL